jgi:phosphotransferase system enzyme I (PtsI)
MQDAGGIGLFRTEFMYLSRNIYPEEEEQFLVYRNVAEGMKGRPVIIRTLDIGADKTVPYLPIVKEDNPAMGIRGVRLCLAQTQLFITQLKALLRASVYGNVSILLPMVSSVWEVEAVKGLIEQAKKLLEEEKKSYKEPKLGIMIETPAAVMIADDLAKCVDFFSIGTNDLTQYILAADRMNPAMGRYTDPYHKAVLKMIEMTVKSGHKAGITVGICGELAADLKMVESFLRMEVDELSVPPEKVLLLRKKIRSIHLLK